MTQCNYSILMSFDIKNTLSLCYTFYWWNCTRKGLGAASLAGLLLYMYLARSLKFYFLNILPKKPCLGMCGNILHSRKLVLTGLLFKMYIFNAFFCLTYMLEKGDKIMCYAVFATSALHLKQSLMIERQNIFFSLKLGKDSIKNPSSFYY